jgi:hypothetical protein
MNNVAKHYCFKTFFVAWSVFFAVFGASCIITGFDSVNEYSNFLNYFFQYFCMTVQLAFLITTPWHYCHREERLEKMLYINSLIEKINSESIKEYELFNKNELNVSGEKIGEKS